MEYNLAADLNYFNFEAPTIQGAVTQIIMKNKKE
jgi:hypothetical protein